LRNWGWWNFMEFNEIFHGIFHGILRNLG
jgi:hypothetical protein